VRWGQVEAETVAEAVAAVVRTKARIGVEKREGPEPAAVARAEVEWSGVGAEGATVAEVERSASLSFS
jgi:hypothetical protein